MFLSHFECGDEKPDPRSTRMPIAVEFAGLGREAGPREPLSEREHGRLAKRTRRRWRFG